MGEKDISEKVLEDYNDVFADIVNVLLFHGERLVKEDELENVKDKSQYKADEKLHEQERDVVKIWRKDGRDCRIRIALFGIENQTDIDADMVFRVLGYDGAGYRRQLLKKEKEEDTREETGIPENETEIEVEGGKERYPVITLVLYFGYERRWKKRTLYEIMDIPEELKPYVSDYRMNVFEIAWLTDEQVQMFQSDFKIVADYFVQMRKNKYYTPSEETIKHVDEILKMMAVLTKDRSFEEAQNMIREEKGEAKSMETFLSKAMRESRAEGEIKGKIEGKIEGEKKLLISQVYKKMLKEQEAEEIAEDLVEEISEIQRIYDIIEEDLPEFDVDKVYERLSAEAVKEPA